MGLLFGFLSNKILLFNVSNKSFSPEKQFAVFNAVIESSCPVATHVFIAADTLLLNVYIAILQLIFCQGFGFICCSPLLHIARFVTLINFICLFKIIKPYCFDTY